MTRKGEKHSNPTPKKVSDAEIVAALIKTGGNMTKTAAKAGLARSVLYERVNASPVLVAAAKEARDVLVDVLEGKLVQVALEGDVHALKMTLTHYGKERKWFVQDPPENKAPPEVRIVISPYRPPSPEEP